MSMNEGRQLSGMTVAACAGWLRALDTPEPVVSWFEMAAPVMVLLPAKVDGALKTAIAIAEGDEADLGGEGG